MTRQQLALLGVGLLSLVGLLLFPPWLAISEWADGHVDADQCGRHFLLAPPRPPSVLPELQATVEERRHRSLDEAIQILGPPDEEMPSRGRERIPAKGRRAPRVSTYRVLTFSKLSDTAEVDLLDYGAEGIRSTFRGKHLSAGRGRRTSR